MPGSPRDFASRGLCTGSRELVPPRGGFSRSVTRRLFHTAAASTVGLLAAVGVSQADVKTDVATPAVIGIPVPSSALRSPPAPLPGAVSRAGGRILRRHHHVVGATRAVTGGCVDAHLMPRPDDLTRVAVATLCLINAYRAADGLAPLSDSPKLDRAARAHSRDMTARGYFDHTSPGGNSLLSRLAAVGYRHRGAGAAGENLAWGTGSYATPASAVDTWMHSPGHRANILRSQFRHSGIGVSAAVPDRSLAGQPGATYTEDFAG